MSKKITQLPELTTPDDADSFVMVDTEAGSTKRVTRGNALANAIGSAELESNAVTTVKITDGSVTPAKLVTGAGTTWVWQSWTPTWVNLTVGNGTVVAAYTQIGKTVVARVSVVFGGTTTLGGDVTFSLPVTRATYGGSANITQANGANLFDTSAARIFNGHVSIGSTTTGVLRVMAADLTYLYTVNLSATVPFTWAVGDEIAFTFTYEAA